VRYATEGGTLHFTTTIESDVSGLELFYWDKGPGIYDFERAIRDGVSTGGSLGSGFGAIRRLTDEFEIYSTTRTTARLSLASARRTTHGTAFLARKLPIATKRDDHATEASAAMRIGSWTRAYPGEEANGDAYFVRTRGDQTLLAVIDGLGHGHGAQTAANVAVELLEEWNGEPPDEILAAAHKALRTTRGAVMGVVIIDRARYCFHYAGVGNILARAFDVPAHASLISANGTLGARLGRVRVWTNNWAEGATLVLASDGLSASWDIDAYPGLLRKSPQLVAGILMRDYARALDDATVLVAR
jgi:serine/threonine protein phosphatase PrpC